MMCVIRCRRTTTSIAGEPVRLTRLSQRFNGVLPARHNRRTDVRGAARELTEANKLSRIYATLLEAPHRHRGTSTQGVTVEHVHVHEGGEAIVGTVDGGGAGW